MNSADCKYILKMGNQNFIVSFLFVVTCICNSNFLVSGCLTSIFNFGDSLSDTGNLVAISRLESGAQLPEIAFPPYGRTFFHRPTGRCCDGRLILDFLAEALGIPYVPPYFGGKEGKQRFKNGVNLAVVGATALDFAFLEERGIYNDVTNISLEVELGFFKHVLPSLCSSSSECKDLLSRSLIVMGEIGGNDYMNGILGGKNPEYVRQFVPVVVQTIALAINELIELGAVTFLVPGITPIGCLPASLTYFQGSDKQDYDPLTGCFKWPNQLVEYHNDLLQKEVQQIRTLHPNVNIVYADLYNALMRLYNSPQQFGITETVKACCGKGGPYNYNSSTPCGDSGVRSCCDDPSKFISWDGLHCTEATYRLIFEFIFEGIKHSIPSFNISSCKLPQFSSS